MIARNSVYDAIVSDAGDVLIAEPRSGKLVVRDAWRGRTVSTLGSLDAGDAAKFSGDGRWVTWTQVDHLAKRADLIMSDAKTGGERWRIPLVWGDRALFPVFGTSNDGAIVWFREDDGIASFDGATGKKLHSKQIEGVIVAATADARAGLFTTPTGATLADLTTGAARTKLSPPIDVQAWQISWLLSQDGTGVFAAHHTGIWESSPPGAPWVRRASFEAPANLNQMGPPPAKLAPTGVSVLLALYDHFAQVTLATGEVSKVPGPHAKPIALSPNGKLALVKRHDRLLLNGAKEPLPPAEEGSARELGFVAGGAGLVTLSHEVNLWDGKSCEHRRRASGTFESPLAVSHAGDRIAAVMQGGGTIVVFDAELTEVGRVRSEARVARMALHERELWVVAYGGAEPAPDAAALPKATLPTDESVIHRVDLTNWSVTKVPLESPQFAVSPSARWLAFNGAQGGRVLDAAKQTALSPALNINGMPTFVSDDLLITAGDGLVRGTLVPSGEVTFTQHVGGPLWAFEVNPTGERLFVSNTQQILVVAPREGRLLGAIDASGARDIALAPDASRLAVATYGGTELWDPAKLVAASPWRTREIALPGVASAAHLRARSRFRLNAVAGGKAGIYELVGPPDFRATLGENIATPVSNSANECWIEAGKARCASSTRHGLFWALDNRSVHSTWSSPQRNRPSTCSSVWVSRARSTRTGT
jgi:hypothetical protein